MVQMDGYIKAIFGYSWVPSPKHNLQTIIMSTQSHPNHKLDSVPKTSPMACIRAVVKCKFLIPSKVVLYRGKIKYLSLCH